MEATLKKKNVHSKALFTEIDEQLMEMLVILDILTDTESVTQLIEMVIGDLAEQYELEQINVICDERNNKMSDIRRGKLIIDVYYKHKNYFNTTHLSYTIQ